MLHDGVVALGLPSNLALKRKPRVCPNHSIVFILRKEYDCAQNCKCFVREKGMLWWSAR